MKRNPDAVAQELEARLRTDLNRTGDFGRIHAVPRSGADVPDDMDTRLVVLGAEFPYAKDGGSPAEAAAKAILESRGSAPRLFRNTLVFLAADRIRLQDLEDAIRKYLAWKSIVDEQKELNLTPFQVRSAETQLASVNGAVTARLPETYQWALVPIQKDPQAPIEWQALRLPTGTDGLAARISRKLRSEELLIASLAGTRLRMELDRVPLWRGDYVLVRQLEEDFAKYLYLARVAGPEVIRGAVSNGLALLTWEHDTFAYAETWDESAGRFRGLRGGTSMNLPEHDPGLVVRPEIARRQLDQDTSSAPASGAAPGAPAPEPVGRGGHGGKPEPAPAAPRQRRFHGSVTLDPTRVARDAGKIAEEVIAHLAGLTGSRVQVTLEISADIPGGVPDQVVRIVTENSRTLRFDSQGFEEE